MENKQKIQEVSSKAVKLLTIIKRLLIVLIIILSISTFVLMIASFTDLLYNLINNNLDIYGTIEIRLQESVGFVSTSRVITLDQVINNDLFYDLMGEMLAKSFVVLSNLIISLVLVNLFRGLFNKMKDLESPFSLELVKSIKAVFIATSILVFINAQLIGIIVALTLSCFYFLYKYGCELQEQYDETL